MGEQTVSGGPGDLADRAEALLQVANLLSAESELSDVLATIAQVLVDSTRHTRASISVWNESNRSLSMAASRGAMAMPPVPTLPYDQASPWLRRAVDELQPQVADYDQSGASRFGGDSSAASHLALLVPVVYRGSLLGVVAIDDPGERQEFSEREIEVVRGIVSQAAAAIELARALAETRASAALGTALAEVDRAVHASLDFDAIMACALAQGAEALGADTAVIAGVEVDGWRFWQAHGFAESIVGMQVTEDDSPHARLAIESGEPVVIEDAETDPRAPSEFLKRYGIRSTSVAPITLRGDAIAVIAFNFTGSPHRFPLAEVSFVRELASSLSIALENARRFEEEREHLTRSRTLNELLELAASADSASALAEESLELITARLGVQVATLWAVDEQRSRLYPLAVHGFGSEWLEEFADGIDIGSTYPVAQAYAEDRAVVYTGGRLDGVPAPVVDAYRAYGVDVDALLALPLHGQQSITGGITLAWSAPQPLTQLDVEYFSSLTRAVGLGIESANHLEAARRRATRFRALHDLAKSATATLEPNDVAHRAFSVLHDLLGVDYAHGFVVNEQRDRLLFLGGIGASEAFFAQVRGGVGLDEPSPIVPVFKTGRAQVQPDVTKADLAPEARSLYERSGLALGAFMLLPLVSKRETIGVLVVAWKEPQRLADEDVDFYVAVANQVATALRNAQLFDEVRSANDRLETTLDTIGDAFVAVDASWRYTIVNDRAAQMLGKPAEYLLDGHRMDEEFPDAAGWPYYRKAMDERVPVTFESYAEMAHAWVEVHLFPTLDGISMIVSDITERKRAQQALQQQATLLAAVNEVLEAGLQARSELELADSCRRIAERITGSAFGLVSEIGPDGLLRGIAMSDPGLGARETAGQTGRRVQPGCLPAEGLYGQVIGDRATFFVNAPDARLATAQVPEGHPPLSAFLGAPLLSGHKVLGMVAVANKPGGYDDADASMLETLSAVIAESLERFRAERQLAHANQRLDAHINNSPLAVIEFDADYRIVRWSDEATVMFGWEAEEVLGKAMGDFRWVYAEDAKLVDAESKKLETGIGRSVSVNRNYRKDGTVIRCQWYDSALYDSQGRMVSILSQVLDITERDSAQAALAASEKRLRDILEAMPMGVTLITADGRSLYANEEYRTILRAGARIDDAGEPPGAEQEERITWLKARDPKTGRPLDHEMRPAVRALSRGERIEDELVELELRDGSTIVNQASVTPLTDERGEVTSAVVVVQNVTSRRERERFEATLNEISAAIMATLDADVVLSRLLQLAREALKVDTAGLTLRERGGWTVREMIPNDGGAPSVSAITDAGLEAALIDAEQHVPIAIDDVRSDPRIDAALMRRLGVKSLLVVPVVVHRDVVAALVFHHRRQAATFSAAQIEFAERLMAFATLALENARLYEREHRIADTLQEAVLTPLEELPGLRTSVIYRPASTSANVGGDFYDLFPLDDGRVCVVVGDVSGKGIEAARLTSLLHDGVRAYAYEDPWPTTVMERVNRLVYRLSPPEMFATLFYGVLDPAGGSLQYCSAGHPEPAIVGRETVELLACEHSPLVGAFRDAPFTTCHTAIGLGDTLVLYTDGVIEARDDEGLFGDERLLATLTKLRHASAEKLPERLLAAVLRFSAGKLRDDTVVMAVSRSGEPL